MDDFSCPARYFFLAFFSAAGEACNEQVYTNFLADSINLFSFLSIDAMNRKNSLLTFLALGMVLVMAAVAVAPSAHAQALIDADIGNVECNQAHQSEQKN
jgi:hypothetical protein